MEPTRRGEQGVIDFLLRCDGSGGKHLFMPAGGSLHPASHETVDKKMHFVHQDGRAVFKYAVQGMVDVAVDLLKRNRIRTEDIALLVPHQANLRIIDAAAERLGLADGKVVRNIEKYANTTAATIPIGLAEACCEEKRVRKGDYILLTAFGGGFTAASFLFRWTM